MDPSEPPESGGRPMADRMAGAPHYDPPPEPEPTGLGTLGMWFRFALLLALVLVPTILLFRAGASRLDDEGLRAGLLVWGGEVRSFQPCSGEEVYWLAGGAEDMDSIRSQYRRVAEARGLEPYDPVLAELRGSISDRRATGFAADYDGTFDLIEIVVIRALRPGECGGP